LPNAPAATGDDIAAVAASLGCEPRQLAAVSKVESAGGGFQPDGRPKILFERHWVHRRIGKVLAWAGLGGQFLAHPDPGGYTLDANKNGKNDSWEKLEAVCSVDPVAAFESCSWGKFQIMGGHWKALGYPDVFVFAWSMTTGEVAHYRALAAFIRANRLDVALRRLSGDPADCIAFAQGYNGKGFRKNAYHEKLAAAMREMGA
jgi:hypothetical protein